MNGLKWKNIIVIVLIILALLTLSICYYNYFLPKGRKYNFPDSSQVEFVKVSKDGEQIDLSDEECKVLYQHIKTARLTRLASAGETPDAPVFYTVQIMTKNDLITGHIYQKNGKFYFEIPYFAVYRLRI